MKKLILASLLVFGVMGFAIEIYIWLLMITR